MRILVCDPIDQEGLDALNKLEDVEVVAKYKNTEEELLELVADVEAILVRSQTTITEKIIKAAKKLQVIGRAGVGVDNIDIEAATRYGVVVVNAPDGNTIAATEHTMAMMLALARNIPQAFNKLKNKEWDRKTFVGVELRNKTLGIVGLGKIGTQVAKRAKSFDMKIVGYDPYVTEDKAKTIGVELLELEELFKRSDFITVHLPKTKETIDMMDKDAFKIMKDEVRIINCARGGIINEADLYEAIKAGQVKGAALDVFLEEPAVDNPLLELNEVIATPHLGASTAEAQFAVAADVAEEVVRVLKGEPVKTAVNIPFIKPEQVEYLKPFLNLSETLGKFISQLMDKPIEKVEIKYNGDLANYDLTTLTNTILKGLLRPILADSVNYVNAPIVAKNRGIKLEEKKSQELKNYANLISLEVEGEDLEYKISGTILKNGDIRLVNLDKFNMDITPTKHMLIVPHKDQPGMVGKVGTVLGEYEVNVASMKVGRKKVGGTAVMIINMDAGVTQEVIEKIEKVAGTFDVRYVCL